MTETLTENILTLNPDGSVTIPKEFLGNVGPDVRFRLEVDGDVLRLERARKLHEIEDPEERVRVFRAFMKNFAQKTEVNWPENYNARNDIYD